MNYEQLYPILAEQNPWWSGANYSPVELNWFKRAQLVQISAKLDIPLMISLTGVRRTGKTTIMRQLLGSILMDNKISKPRIMFFSFDEEIIAHNANVLEGIIKTYLDRILKKNLWEINERVFIFLDEVQDVEHWQAVLKRFYDQNKNLKFIISGSASLFIKEKAKESLAGRIFEYHIPPFDFREFLSLSKTGVDLPEINIFEESSLVDSKLQETVLQFGPRLQGLFNQYLIKGGFPEAASMQTTVDSFKYIKDSILKKVLTSDIPKHFGIQKHDELSLLFKALCRDTAQIIEFKNISFDCSLSIETVSSYINCFYESLLIDILYNYTRSARKQVRTQKKIYAASPNFTTALYGIHEYSEAMGDIFGHLVETYAFWKLRATTDSIFFMREHEKEVDFFCVRGMTKTLIESKYSNSIKPADIKPMLYFMEKRKIKNGVILTKGLLDLKTFDDKKILYLPVWCL